MAGTLTPTPYQTVLDGDGVAVSGAKVYTYEAGTTTNATTYTTSALNVANANPIVADSAGRYVAYLAAGQNLRFIIKTSADVTIDDQDNIQSVPGSSVNLDIEGTVGEAVVAGQVVYLSSAAESTPLTAGKWYLTDSDAAATSTTAQTIGVAVSAIAINTSGTIRLAGLVTTAGAVVVGTTYYVGPTPGALVSSAPALSRQVGVAMTTSTLVLAATTVVAASIPNPISQDLLFTDATYDIGKSGATRPRDLFTSRNATVGADIVVSGTGPHAMGAVVNDFTRLQLDGAFTSGGASTAMFGMHTAGVLTGHSADSDALVGTKLDNSIVTTGSSTTVAQLWVTEPQITVGSGTVTNSATVYVEGAASEAGTANHALWVDSGSTRLDGTLTVGSTAADAIDVAGGINTGSGNVALVNAAGKITALSGTEVDNLSGAALTSLDAGNISAGTLAVARGGTGATSLTDGYVLLGSGTGAVTPLDVTADGAMLVGDGSGDPVAESGSTLRASIGCDSATNLTSGTLANARLPSDVDLGGTLDVTGVTTLDSNATMASGAKLMLGSATSGIGGATVPLQINGTSGALSGMQTGRFSGDSGSASFNFVKSRAGSVGGNTVVNVADSLGYINWYGDDGTDYATPGASIGVFVDGTPGSNDMPGRIDFSVTPDGGAAVDNTLSMYATGMCRFNGGVTTGLCDLQLNNGQISLADGATVEVSVNTGALIMVSWFLGSGGAYYSGLFWASYASSTIIELGDPNGNFEVTDTGTGYALYKGVVNGFLYIKNRTGGAKNTAVNVIHCGGN